MAHPLLDLVNTLNTAKTAGTVSIIGDVMPLAFSPRTPALTLPASHTALTEYEDRLRVHYPNEGVVAAHMAKIREGGKRVSLRLPRRSGMKISGGATSVSTTDDVAGVNVMLRRVEKGMKKWVTGAISDILNASQLTAMQNAIIDEFSEATLIDTGVKGNGGYGSFYLGTYVGHHPACCPTPGYFTIILSDCAYRDPNIAGTTNIRVLKVPVVDTPANFLGMIVGCPSSNTSDAWYQPLFLIRRPSTLAGASAEIHVEAAQASAMNGNTTGIRFGSRPDGSRGVVCIFSTLDGTVLTAPPLVYRMASLFKASFAGPSTIPFAAFQASLDQAFSDRVAAIAVSSGLDRDSVIRESLLNSGWVVIGKDYSINHVVSQVVVDWEPSEGPQPLTTAVQSLLPFANLANLLEASLPAGAERDGLVARLRKDPSAYYVSYASMGRVMYPQKDPLYRTQVYSASVEAGSDIKGTFMIEKDPDDVESQAVTFGQANSLVAKYSKGLVAYLGTASVASQSGALLPSLLTIDNRGGVFTYTDEWGGEVNLDDVYSFLAMRPIESLTITAPAAAVIDSYASVAPLPVSYPERLDKLCRSLFSSSYGAITVVLSGSGAADGNWGTPLDGNGMLKHPDSWPSEYWLSWAAGAVQKASPLVSGVMFNPGSLGPLVNENLALAM